MGKLTAAALRRLVEPGRYGDGAGLWLQVRDADQRSWLFRFRRAGKARQMGLGSVADVTLAEAREAADRCRALLREGRDPIEVRKTERRRVAAAAAGHTFESAAKAYIAAHRSGWRNAKHAKQWSATLSTHAFGTIGSTSIAALNVDDVLAVLRPIWTTKPETASRLRGRMEAIIDYARAHGWREGENPARWRGHLALLLPPRSKVAPTVNHPALPWQHVAEFVAELRSRPPSAAGRALELLILTAARTTEIRAATWGEMDLKGAVWTIPAGRTKAAREHRIPLSEPALAVLRAVMPATVDPLAFVFPGAGKRRRRPLSEMALLMMIRRMNGLKATPKVAPRWLDRAGVPVVPHGFRSTFRTWAAEATTYPREVAEAALAHALESKTEAAYQRGDLFARRAALMREWGEFCIARPYPVNRSDDVGGKPEV